MFLSLKMTYHTTFCWQYLAEYSVFNRCLVFENNVPICSHTATRKATILCYLSGIKFMGFFFLIVLIHNWIHYPEMQRKVVWKKKIWMVTGYLMILKNYLGQNDSIMVMFLFFLLNRVLIFYRYIPKYLWIRWFYFGDFLGFSSKWSSFRGGGINQTRAAVSCITIAEHSSAMSIYTGFTVWYDLNFP